MFNSGIKGNQRCNGIYSSPNDLTVANKVVSHPKLYNNSSYKVVNRLEAKDVLNQKKSVDRQIKKNPTHAVSTATSFNGSSFGVKVTKSMEEHDYDKKRTVHSIIGFNNLSTHKPPIEQKIKKEKPAIVLEQKVKKENVRATHHETLQRIEVEKDEFNYYQQHWFSVGLEKLKTEDRSREERIEITRHELTRQVQQILRSNVGKRNKMPDWIERRKEQFAARKNRHRGIAGPIAVPKLCEVENCGKLTLACAKYCMTHIMLDTKQVLFEYCTAKFADNTQCSVPVFDISHELPLCAEHARKRDNYRLYLEAKPKKIRKKVKPSAMIRPQKRSKKKKKPPTKSNETLSNMSNMSSAIINEITIPSGVLPTTSTVGLVTKQSKPPVAEIDTTGSVAELEEDLQIDQVLSLNENGLEQALATQAHLLEESDISNVLSTIQVDEFSDFFAVNRNGEYEPSREEAEELEKALAAVDNDVKSLEKLSQTHGLLDSFLDEHALADSLVQIPEMFHNGYAICGDNIVAQNNSYLLPVEPHSSHS